MGWACMCQRDRANRAPLSLTPSPTFIPLPPHPAMPTSAFTQGQQDLVREGIENFELPNAVAKVASLIDPGEGDGAVACEELSGIHSLPGFFGVASSLCFVDDAFSRYVRQPSVDSSLNLSTSANSVAVLKQRRAPSASNALVVLRMVEFGGLVEVNFLVHG
jgi:hypothetical protein